MGGTFSSVARTISNNRLERVKLRDPQYLGLQDQERSREIEAYNNWVNRRAEAARDLYSQGRLNNLSTEDVEETLDAIVGENPLGESGKFDN